MKRKLIFLFISLFILFNSPKSFAEKSRIALFYPKKTIQMLTQNGDWLINNFYRWELFLTQNKFNYEVIYDEQLEDISTDDFSLLILPSAKYLSGEDISAIKRFMEYGGSVIATAGFGVLNENGGFAGWKNLEQLFGLKFVSEISEKEYSKIHSIIGGQAFSTNIPPGFRLQLTTNDKPIEVKINSDITKPLGYWLNNDAPFEGKAKSERTTSAVYGKYGRGKFVWLGFEFSSVVGAKEHTKIANQLWLNLINWLSGGIVFYLETWPEGHQCAAVISCDVEEKFPLINNALDILEKEIIPAQFYILTESIDFPSFIRLSKFGDIGFHGDEHTLFKWQSFDHQLQRLNNGIKFLMELTGKKPISFRPPETFYDDLTLAAMSEAGIRVLTSDFIGDRAVPQWLENYQDILIIPKTGYDDYDAFYNKKLKLSSEQSDLYIKDFLRTYEEGGLYTLNYHTQIQCRPELVEALIDPIKLIKSKNVWITTHDSVYYWWLAKEKINVVCRNLNDGKFTVDITNQNENDMKSLVLVIHMNNIWDKGLLKAISNNILLNVEKDFTEDKYKIKIPLISAGKAIQIKIEF